MKVNSYFNTSPNLVGGTWYHFAWVHIGATGVNQVFQDGVQIGAVTETTAFPDVTGTTNLFIGSSATPNNYLSGWLDEFRVSKGVARWTSNFTPPIGSYARDANTVLLLHMDGADASTTFIDSY